MIQENLFGDRLESVLIVTLSRTNNSNIISTEMLISLTFAIHNAQKDQNVRVIMIKNLGNPAAKESHAAEIEKSTFDQINQHTRILNECIITMKKSEKPIIAAVHGFTSGDHLCLTFASDWIVAVEDSMFASIRNQRHHVKKKVLLPILIGPFLTDQIINKKELLSATRLHELGAVNLLTSIHNLQEETINLASRLANTPQKTFSALKKLIGRSLITSIEEIIKGEYMDQ